MSGINEQESRAEGGVPEGIGSRGERSGVAKGGFGEDGAPGEAREKRGLPITEWTCALALAALFIFLVGRLTNRITPSEFSVDEKLYVKMAAEGPLTARPRIAPFAYRPGTVLVAGAVARVANIPPDRAYEVLAAVALPVFLALLYALARLYTASRWRAGIATLLVALSYSAVKRLLFDPISPDSLGLVFVVVATILVAQRRIVPLTVVTAFGVLFREFVIIPAVALAAEEFRGLYAQRGRLRLRNVGAALLPLAAGLVPYLLLRVLLPGEATAQHVDPWARSTWRNALQIFEGPWVINAVGSWVTFLWPLVALPWKTQENRVALPLWARSYALVLALVTLCAGSNFMWFAAYFAPFLVVAWAVKATQVPWPLCLILLWLVALVNRTMEPIPSPRDFDAYVGHMAFFGSRVDLNTGLRVLVLTSAIVTYTGLAALVSSRHAKSENTQ